MADEQALQFVALLSLEGDVSRELCLGYNTQTSFKKRNEAHRAGQLVEANRLYTAILQSQPKHPDANHNMGVLANGTGSFQDALPFFKTALEAKPNTAQFWLSYIDCLIKLGQFSDAKFVLEQAKNNGAAGKSFVELEQRIKAFEKLPANLSAKFEPDEPTQVNILDTIKLSTALKLAQKKFKKGSIKSSEKIYRDILERFPKNKNAIKGMQSISQALFKERSKVNDPQPEQLKHFIKLYNQGLFQKALDESSRLIESFPNSSTLYNIRGVTYKEIGNFDAAIYNFEQAEQLNPNYFVALYNKGVVLQLQEEFCAAAESYRKALHLKPDFDDANINLGNVLKESGAIDSAVASYRKVLETKPHHAKAYNNLGIAFMEKNEITLASESFKQALKIDPQYADAHRHFSKIHKYSLDDPYFSQIKIAIKNAQITERERCILYFAIAKAYRDLKEFKKDFKCLSKGNSLRKKLLNYDIQEDKRLFRLLKDQQKIISKFNVGIEKICNGVVPIFILGMPRSGTTLIENIISSHSAVTGAGELNAVNRFGRKISLGLHPLSEEKILEFRESYLKALKSKSNEKRIVTDKMPQNFRFIPLICKAFPEAKIIHSWRNPKATCWSNFQNYFVNSDLGYCYDLKDLVIYYKLYEDLMQTWHVLYADRIYKINYEKLTSDPDCEIKKLIHHLGLSWEDSCLFPHENMRNVSTASQQQVRRKIYKGSSKAWRKYANFLKGSFSTL